MKFKLEGVAEFESEQVVGVQYPNDMLDGLFIDLGEKCMFMSNHVAYHRHLIHEIIEADPDITGCDMSDCEPDNIDLDSTPHRWIISRLADIVVRSAEKLTEGAVDDS